MKVKIKKGSEIRELSTEQEEGPCPFCDLLRGYFPGDSCSGVGCEAITIGIYGDKEPKVVR